MSPPHRPRTQGGMNTLDFQSRQPKGIRIGGQYMQATLPESGLGLSGPITVPVNRDAISHRHQLLSEGGYVPGGVVASASINKDVHDPEAWWDRSLAAGEYGARGRSYTKMPDDFTPKKTSGRALSGKRRTHRMQYTGAGVDLRMPSATSIKAFSGENGNPTFDIPVSVSMDDGPTTNNVWVRVTKTGPHSWKTTAVGIEGDRADRIAESVSAVLESRRPTVGLKAAGDLLERRKAKQDAEGFEMVKPPGGKKSFIAGIGYDESTGTMGTAIGDKLYGHHVPKNVFEAVKQGGSPGKIFNLLVKGQEKAQLDRCGECKRYYASTVEHTCPTEHKAKSGLGLAYGRKARKRATQATERLSAREPAPAPVEPAPRVADLSGRWKAESVTPDRAGLLGPQGYSAKAVEALAPFTSEKYMPSRWRGERENNEQLVHFDGVSGGAAAQALKNLPKEAQEISQNGAPTVAQLLGAAAYNPGLMEVSGYMVSPSRTDERISVDGMRYYDDELAAKLEKDGWPQGHERRAIAEEKVWKHAADRLGFPRRLRQMPEISVSEAPWQGGRKMISFSWD